MTPKQVVDKLVALIGAVGLKVQVDGPSVGGEYFINCTNGTNGFVINYPLPGDLGFGLSSLPGEGYGMYAPDEIHKEEAQVVGRICHLILTNSKTKCT